ncbi:Auxin-responsive protein IAA13, putative isoform 1 [Hibiscus syriacus]|uniref:Auxin-responsive protein IAA13, putative isoform 1 n=1 Tax=Hibiscus syriacus TaxID=106335 RepID=A0A6A2YPC0_HIBSY|nr:uncharacterized protein LOC120159126 [Hibiscus syriacus]KAE8681179.1 Auxin-responsive protein IAA13, putative isoform 1 [Hibiscus syriacus]
MDVSTPLRLLELNLISAQDLEPIVRRGMKTYAVAWVNPKRKLTTRIDTEGHTNPTWNDKFIFRVDDLFLSSETSAVMVEVYAVHWFRDIHVGTVRIIVGNLLKSSSSGHQCLEFELGMRFVALQVRRPSGRPQGILNIGLTLLDGSRRSMPLYMQMGSSAVGYQYFMGEDEPVQSSDRSNNNNNNQFSFEPIKHELRRTLSDSSSMLGSQYVPMISFKGSSIFNTGGGGGPSERSDYKIKSRGSSMLNYTFENGTNKKEKSSTIIYGSSGLTFGGFDHRARKYDSDLGPSPSEVAAAVAKIKTQNKTDEAESSLVGSWSLDESMEGIVSKLERWRVELPPMYDHDRDGYSDGSRVSSSSLGKALTAPNKKTKHTRRRSSPGLFSCFGTICGHEFSIKCSGAGGGANAGKKRKICTKPLQRVA